MGTALAQQPERLNEIPPVLLHVREAIGGGGGGGGIPSQGEGYLDTDWEVEVPRRSIRFLASSLLILSAMQVRNGAGGGDTGGGRGGGRPIWQRGCVLM